MPTIERLDPARHNLDAFRCADRSYEHYLRRRAAEHGALGLNVAYVALDETGAVVGYSTLSMGHVPLGEMDEVRREGLPGFPVPVLHLGRLATHKAYPKRGIGSELVRHAMRTSVRLSEEVGCHALQLFAASDELLAFYARLGFRPLRADVRSLYLPVSEIREVLDDEAPGA